MGTSGDGPDGFRAALAAREVTSTVVGGLVVHELEVVTGNRAGQAVEVGVELEELAPWPVNPPHWIHLANEVMFATTNAQPSPRPGWSKHSRQIDRWGLGPDPLTEWLAHLRRVIGDAA